MTGQIDGHYQSAQRYDQYYGAYRRLPDWFLAELSDRQALLELACGTGRIAIPLAEAGYQVTGLDNSPAMLALARAKAATEGVTLEWLLGDMTGFDTGRRYEAILLLSNALWHLHSRAQFEGCLAAVRRHLRPNGRLIIDVFVPSLEILQRDPERRYPFAQYDDPDSGALVAVTEQYRYNPLTQIAHIVHYRGESDEVIGDLNLRMYFPRELQALLHYNGWQIASAYGSWAGAPLDDSAENQIYFCSTA